MGDGLTLMRALRIDSSGALVAFVGAGGKTSLMLALARELPGRVVVTTTTRMGWGQIEQAAAELDALVVTYPALPTGQVGTVLLVGEREGEKVRGVPPEVPRELLARNLADLVVVEADGARRRPVKAPAAHEPVIPSGATLVVPVVGIDALHGRITDVAHRPALAAKLLADRGQISTPTEQISGASEEHRLTAADITTLLTDAQGGLKDVPDGARVVGFVNKVETTAQLAAAREIAILALREPSVMAVALGAAQQVPPVCEVVERVTAVVLAAGEARRMGRTKQLLPWGTTTVLGQTLRNVQASAVFDTVVVSGHAAERVEVIAAAAGARSVRNPDFARGEMLSSLQTAVAQLPTTTAAVLVVLADQPTVEPETINRLLHAFWQGRSDIVAPTFNSQRGNPVLIGRRHFNELLALPPGGAPRDLLKRHSVHLVDAPSDAVLQDLDRIEEYERLRPG